MFRSKFSTIGEKDLSHFFEMFIFIWYVMHISRHSSHSYVVQNSTQSNSSLRLTRNLSIQKLLYCSRAVAITMRYWENCQICRSLWLMFSFCKSQRRALHERWMILMESWGKRKRQSVSRYRVGKKYYSSITCI